MPYIIKSNGDYIHSAPNFRKAKANGVCATDDKLRAKRFDTAEQAREWLKDIRDKQRQAWPSFRFLASGYPVQIKI